MKDVINIFEDKIIKLQIPKRLKLKRGTLYFFSGALKCCKNVRFNLMIALDPPSVVRRSTRKMILDVLSSETWLGVESSVIRKGKCSFGNGGVEVFGMSTVPNATGKIILYRWTVLYKLGKHYLNVDMIGGGELCEFEKIGTDIIQSIVVK